jgi:hypothetical protein
MEEQRIKKALAPAQWYELKQTLEKECWGISRACPALLSCETEYAHEAVVRNLRTGRITSLRYDPDVPCVHFENPGTSEAFTFRVSVDGTRLQFMYRELPRLSRELVHEIIRSVF